MAVAPFSATSARAVDMDFARISYFVESNVILYKKPDPDADQVTIFLRVSYNFLFRCCVLIDI